MIPLYKNAEAIAWLKKWGTSSGNDSGTVPAPPPLTTSTSGGPPLAGAKHIASSNSIQQTVEQIIATVKAEGDAGIHQLASRFGDAVMPPLFMEEEGISALAAQLPKSTRQTIDLAAQRIRTFAEATLQAMRPIHVSYERFDTGLNFRPVNRVACYVPSGRYPLASTALMTAITAKVAGVAEVFILSPNLKDEILYAGTIAGVTEFHQIGGAQAVAAAAFGTKTIKPADMIVGPGNAYVTEAKRQLQGTIGIDMLAGPSEICIIADSGSNPHWLALDLLSQAEHDPDARAILLTDDDSIARQVLAELPKARTEVLLPDFIDESLSNSVILVLPDIVACIQAANSIAPEHLQLHVSKPEDLQPHLVNYGCMFIGYNATVPNGDYVAGPNHTLPTNRSARFAGALNPFTFLRAQTWVRVRSHADELHQETEAFANLEGLNAHAAAPRARYLSNRESESSES